MSHAPAHPRDPIGWSLLLTAGFAALCFTRLAIPGIIMFDEVHYVPAARTLMELSGPANVEHPMVGKQLIALGIWLFGDEPFGWRVMAALFGVIGFFAGLRAMWFASCSRFATVAFGLLLATGFPLVIHARIAMLDSFMVGFLLLALWQLAAAVREAETARWRLALAGVFMGLAMGAKWSVLALMPVPGLAFLAVRAMNYHGNILTCRRGAPVPGISLLEAGLWLGAVPLLTYFASFWPYLVYENYALGLTDLVSLQWDMLDLQGQVIEPHPYQSVWYQWVGNWRAIWYLYENVDGAQRAVVLLGNPFSSLVGLIGFGWCAWAGWKGNRAALALAVLYAVSIGFWIVAAKPIQFYYHYLVPHTLLMGCMALWLDAMWQRGWKWLAAAILAISALMFAYFWPALSAAALEGERSFEDYTWLESWA